MSARAFDPLELKNQADAVLERTAERLHDLLRAAVGRLDPFPPYPGAFFTYGIEVDVPALESPERGCVILAPDGELYELVLGHEVPVVPEDIADPVAMRKEELKKLEDLPPCDYILYAYNALARVVETLREQGAEKA